MQVFLRKDIEKVGLAGEIIKVSDGFALNFLIPQGLAMVVTSSNEAAFRKKVTLVKNRKEVIASKTSMLAEKIKSLELTLKRKLHDGKKLYGAIGAGEIADLLGEKGVKVAKNQIIFEKAIKEVGVYSVIIKLSSTLQPSLTVKVIAE